MAYQLKIQTYNNIVLYQIFCQCTQGRSFSILPRTVYRKILPCIYHLFYLFKTIRYIYHIVKRRLTVCRDIKCSAHHTFLPDLIVSPENTSDICI